MLAENLPVYVHARPFVYPSLCTLYGISSFDRYFAQKSQVRAFTYTSACLDLKTHTFSPSKSHSTKRPGGGTEGHWTRRSVSAAWGPDKENTALSSDRVDTMVLARKEGASEKNTSKEDKDWE